MSLFIKFFGVLVVVVFFVGVVMVDFVLIFDLGGKFDKLFNELVFNGVICWVEEIGGFFVEFEIIFDV